MSYRCSITQQGPLYGHKVSHANNKTKMRRLPNLQVKSFYVPELKRKMRLRVSCRTLRTIDKKGLSEVLKVNALSARDFI